MRKHCHCGQEVNTLFEDLGCLECGAACCPSCAYTPEDVVYCARCAEDRFGPIPFAMLSQVVPSSRVAYAF